MERQGEGVSLKLAILALLLAIQGGAAFRVLEPEHHHEPLEKALEFEEGGGKEHESEHHAGGGEMGSKSYAAFHEFDEGAKGHHDAESLKGRHAEEGGAERRHHHDEGHHQEHEAASKGRKGHAYKEQGSYAKGHSIKGGHKIHKLDEYKKNTDFYDEDHDEGFAEKHGGYEREAAHGAGGHEKGGHFEEGHREGGFGKSGAYEKGSRYHQELGHEARQGDEGHHEHGELFGEKGGREGFKRWGFREGHGGY